MSTSKFEDDSFNGYCPTCGQPFLKEAVELLKDTLEFLHVEWLGNWASDLEESIHEYLEGIGKVDYVKTEDSSNEMGGTE